MILKRKIIIELAAGNALRNAARRWTFPASALRAFPEQCRRLPAQRRFLRLEVRQVDIQEVLREGARVAFGTTKSLNASPNSRSISPGAANSACHTPESIRLAAGSLRLLAAQVPDCHRESAAFRASGKCNHCACALIATSTNSPASRGFGTFTPRSSMLL